MEPEVLGERPRDMRVKGELDKHGIEAVYLLDKPRIASAPAEEKRSWYQDNDHLTPRGHALWAQLIREELVRVLPKRGLMARKETWNPQH